MKREYVIYQCDRCKRETDPDEHSWMNAKPPSGWMVVRMHVADLGPDGAVRHEGLFCPDCVEAVLHAWRNDG